MILFLDIFSQMSEDLDYTYCDTLYMDDDEDDDDLLSEDSYPTNPTSLFNYEIQLKNRELELVKINFKYKSLEYKVHTLIMQKKALEIKLKELDLRFKEFELKKQKMDSIYTNPIKEYQVELELRNLILNIKK